MVKAGMRRQHVEVEVHTPADAATVYGLLRDGASWPTWSPIESFELERAGAGEPEGIGAIRIFRKGRVTGRDEVAELVPDRRFSYRHLSGLPVRDYRGDVDLEPDEGGTRIRWHISFLPRSPGTGWLWRWGSSGWSASPRGAWLRTRPPRRRASCHAGSSRSPRRR